MTSREIALELDAEDRPIEAANAYEEAIKEADADFYLYMNLAILYFVCTDGGYASYHNLSNEFVDRAWDRAIKLLDEAESRFGRNDEIEFWRRYIRYIVLGEDESIMERERFIYSRSLIPYFYLFISGDGKDYYSEAQNLLEQVANGSTAKERYIKSILVSRVTLPLP
ncbi:MAG TPA: hypothetical protein VFV58_38125 [Blastocatellia bacterium]|jgi:hypothetical protein|nr:hypothetical protein [Blastocatellia bacterium]